MTGIQYHILLFIVLKYNVLLLLFSTTVCKHVAGMYVIKRYTNLRIDKESANNHQKNAKTKQKLEKERECEVYLI